MHSLLIENFKNIRHLKLENLRKVNLIVGKNNVGKSTLLEAISLYLSKGIPSYLMRLLDYRGELQSRQEETDEERKEHYLSFFYGYKENYSKENYVFVGENSQDPLAVRLFQVYIKERIEKDDDGNERRLRSRLFEEDLEEADNLLEQGLYVSSPIPSLLPYASMRRFFIAKDPIMPFQFVDARVFDIEQNAVLFDKISLSPDENYVVEALRIINPDIERIAYITSSNKRDRYPIVTLKGDSRRYRLSAMGDGINRILTIILSLLNSKNGFLLLDEFETGLHYSVQKQLWEIIFMLANELNIQVFVTSHSSDCLKTFSKANVKEQGLLIRLEQRKSGMVPVFYTNTSDIDFASENNIELR